MLTDTFTASFPHKINDRLIPDSFRDNGNRKTGWVSANDPPFWKQRVPEAMLRVLPLTFKPVNNLICCKTGLNAVGKTWTSLFNLFCSDVARQVTRFLLPVFPYLQSFPTLGLRGCYKMRPSAQHFLWKWVLFAWEWKNHFHIKGWALNLALIRGSAGTRKKHNACLPRCSGIKGTQAVYLGVSRVHRFEYYHDSCHWINRTQFYYLTMIPQNQCVVLNKE